MSHHRHHPDPDKPELDAILRREDAILEEVEEVEQADRKILRDDREILHRLEEIEHELHHPHTVTNFTDIKEIPPMVPLAAGQTATFATTPIPDGTAVDTTKIVWSTSHPDIAPIVVNPTDPSALSAQITFADSTPEGVSFAVIINYTNPDGKVVSKTNTFVTVAKPPVDISDFTDIVQVN